MPMPPIDLVGSPLHPFGLSSAPSFGSPFGTLGGGHAPTPWNSSPPSSSASPFAYRSTAASRAHSQGAAAAAAAASSTAAASSSPFNSFSGPSFEGLFSGHDDDLYQFLSSPTPFDHAPQRRGSGGTTSRTTRHFEYNTNREDRSSFSMGQRNLDRQRRGGATSSSRSSSNLSPAPAAAAGRSRETALEIHDSDEEVVEVIDLVS